MKKAQSREQKPKLVDRTLVRLVEVVCRFPFLTLVLTLGLAGYSIFAFCTHLKYSTSRNDLISPNKDYQRRWNQYLADFGNDDDIVVVVEGKDRAQMREAIESLATEVRRKSDMFDRLFYKVDLRPLQDRALLFLPSDLIETILVDLRRMQLLLDLKDISWPNLTLVQLLRDGRGRAGKISPGKPLTPADQQYFHQLLGLAQSAKSTLENPGNYKDPWQSIVPADPEEEKMLTEPQYFFSGDGTLAFLLTRPTEEKGSITAAGKAVAAMGDIVNSMRASYPNLSFGMTGMPVLETDEMTASQQDTQASSWLALGGVLTLYLIVFRSLRYPILMTATLLVGTAWAAGWLTLTVGHLNILSATFAMMLIGMGDYAVLWVTRFEQERLAGHDVITANCQTAASVGRGILAASATTALAFFAAVLADFQAVSELGWIAGSGVLLCAFASFTVMPALLCITDRRVILAQAAPLPAAQTVWLPFLARRPRLVISVGVAATAILAFYAIHVRYDHNLLHLQARGLESVQWEQKLCERTAGASMHALSIQGSQEEALAMKARLEKLPEVARVEGIASLIPLDQERKRAQLKDIQERLRNLPERGTTVPHHIPNTVDLMTELSVLTDQLQPLADRCPSPLLHELRRGLVALKDKIEEVAPRIAETRLQNFEERFTADLIQNMYRLRDASKPASITLADIPPALLERHRSPNGKWLLRVFAKESLWEFGSLEQFCKQIQTVDPEATGKPFTTMEGLRGMRNGFMWAGCYAFGAIAVVLLIDFRNPKFVFLALASLTTGVTITMGIMGLCGMSLNPANMIAFPLIVGVGTAWPIYVLTNYRSKPDDGRRYLLSRTIGKGVSVAASTTILGFGVLMISRHRGLFGLGLILSLGVSCCMVSALVLLPAVLRVLSKKHVRQAPVITEHPQRLARAA